jgi:hypothetical protein
VDLVSGRVSGLALRGEAKEILDVMLDIQLVNELQKTRSSKFQNETTIIRRQAESERTSSPSRQLARKSAALPVLISANETATMRL